jgi:hypothetical protein
MAVVWVEVVLGPRRFHVRMYMNMLLGRLLLGPLALIAAARRRSRAGALRAVHTAGLAAKCQGRALPGPSDLSGG